MSAYAVPIRIGTRGSDLALAQTREVIAAVGAAVPGVAFETVVISTRGDRDTARPFAAVGSRGIFTGDIETALLTGTIDLAVHSLKDLESELPDGLRIGAVLPRADARDALAASPFGTLATLPVGARIGTSSVRRAALLRQLRPDVRVVPVRGNVPTRLRKARDEGLDGVVLACAGLDRLALHTTITERLDPSVFVPEAGQGFIAIEVAKATAFAGVLAAVNDPAGAACAAAERACVRALGGSCQTPIAAYATIAGSQLRLRSMVCRRDGQQVIRSEGTAPIADAEQLGRRLASALLADGAAALLAEAAAGPA